MIRHAAALILIVLAVPAPAGPLLPRVGPVDETYKTLQQVEPRTPINADTTPGDADSLYRIPRSGSYYLTQDLFGVSGKSGIEIAAPGVEIDLNGYQVSGFIFGGPPTLDGIRTDGVQNNITIVNGTVGLWGRHGIDMRTGPNNTAGDHALIERVNAIGNSQTGIRTNDAARIALSVASNNGEHGINAIGATVTDSIANENGSFGFNVSASQVSRCVANSNGSSGIGGTDSVYTECIASGNTTAGIIGTENIVSRCRVSGSTNGIPCFGNALLTDNVVTGCTSGFYVSGSNSRLERNTTVQCTTGYEIVGQRNFLMSNLSTQSGTPYDINSNNYFGTIVNRNGVATGSVTGASSPSTLGTTDPHANFSR